MLSSQTVYVLKPLQIRETPQRDRLRVWPISHNCLPSTEFIRRLQVPDPSPTARHGKRQRIASL